MSEPEGKQQTGPQGELERVIGQRQKLKRARDKLEADNLALEGQLAQATKAAAPNMPEGARQEFLDLSTQAAALKAGAFNHTQVATILRPNSHVVENDAGSHAVMTLCEDGILRPVDEAARLLLEDPRNVNLISAQRAEDYRASHEHKEQLATHAKSPPANMDEVAALPDDIRDEVIDNMSPEQRAELVNPSCDRLL